MHLGFALVRHCNLRCPHCIRDDLTDVRALAPELLARVLDEARELFGSVRVSFSGGEPLLHPDLEGVVGVLSERDAPWRMVSNGWHMVRALPALERHAPEVVHLSLSGATREAHDAERGRGSWDRLLGAVALLTSRRVPVHLSLIVDRRTVGRLERALELARELGCPGLQYILPQPVPGSAARGTDLPPGRWPDVRRRVEALIRRAGEGGTTVGLAYGAPSEGPEAPCPTFTGERLYVDAEGRLTSCCQLSQYGGNEAEVVADLSRIGLAEAYRRYRRRLDEQWCATRPAAGADDPFLDFPCMRCAASHGKLDWLGRFPDSPWSDAADMEGVRPVEAATGGGAE